jgi:predicted Zn finger-like uncharacterized protein
MKAKARTIARLTLVVYLLGAVLGLCCVFMRLGMAWRLIDCAIVTISLMLLTLATRCPYCGSLFAIKLHPLAPNAGPCKQCGQLVEFDRGELLIKTQNRALTRRVSVIFPLGMILGLCCVYMGLGMIWRFIDYVIVTVGLMLLTPATRCPHCGSFLAIKLHPLAANAGRCKKCGELVEFDR